jgi:hemoglobin
MAASLFERYGGFGSLSKVVSAFYDKILDSPITSPYFAGIDMKRQIEHQTKFIASLMGGPASYTDDALARSHSNLKIDQAAFEEMAMLLMETLEDFDFDPTDVASLKNEIVSRSRFVITR